MTYFDPYIKLGLMVSLDLNAGWWVGSYAMVLWLDQLARLQPWLYRPSVFRFLKASVAKVGKLSA